MMLLRQMWAIFLLIPLMLNGAEEVCLKQPLLIVNSITTSPTLPVRFRTTKDLLLSEYYSFSLEGLSDLNASASSQFSIEELRALVDHLSSKQLVIFDLRKESHGYINNYAVSWYVPKNWLNKERNLDEIFFDERERLAAVMDRREIILHKIVEKAYGSSYATALKLPVSAHFVCTEEELCTSFNIGYVRVAVTDHLRPTDEMVDHFVLAVKNLSEGQWPHFHCKSGQGRATTFMTLYDIMHNADRVSLDDIIKRQWTLGGINLFHFPPPTSWKYLHFLERKEFLMKFYDYCRDQAPDFHTSWSFWTEHHKEKRRKVSL